MTGLFLKNPQNTTTPAMRNHLHTLLVMFFAALPFTASAEGELQSLCLGYCNETFKSSFSLPRGRESVVAVRFDEDFVKRYDGCRVTAIRVCFGDQIGATAGVWLGEYDDFIAYHPGDDDYSKALAGTPEKFAYHFPYEAWIGLPADAEGENAIKRQWTEVTLPEPYTIREAEAFYAGFRTWAKDENQRAVIGCSGNITEEHSWVNLNGDWWQMLAFQSLTDLGLNLMLQVRVEGENLPTNDITLTSVEGPVFLKTYEDYDYECIVTNNAMNVVNNCTLTCYVDSKETIKNKLIEFPVGIGYKESTVIDLKELAFYEPGMHHIEVFVTDPNGVEDYNPADNYLIKTIEAYNAEDAIERHILVETFSTANCVNCPAAHEREAEAFAGTDVIEVCHHSGFGTDLLTTDADRAYTWLYNNTATYAPAIMFDRTNVNNFYDTKMDSPVFGTPSVENLHMIYETLKEVPAYVDVNINGAYDPATRALNLTVSGNTIAIPVGSDHRLNVWIIENNVKIRQPQEGSALGADYLHQHVFRETLSDTWGRVMNLKQSAYSEAFEYVLPETMDADNVEIVAFLSNYNPYNANDCKVFNAQKVALGNLISESIANVPMAPFTDGTYYNLAGCRTTHTSGITIDASRKVKVAR